MTCAWRTNYVLYKEGFDPKTLADPFKVKVDVDTDGRVRLTATPPLGCEPTDDEGYLITDILSEQVEPLDVLIIKCIWIDEFELSGYALAFHNGSQTDVDLEDIVAMVEGTYGIRPDTVP